MKKSIIITIVCVIVAAVIVVGALFALGVFNPAPQDTGTSSGEQIVGNITPTPEETSTGSADQIIGNWHGTKSVLGVATADVNVEFKSDNTGVIDGTVDAPSFGYNKVPLKLDFTYEYEGGNAYTMKKGDHETLITCDGTTTVIKINPSQINSNYPSMEIEMNLKRI